MSAKVILYIAMSLDGFIADSKGSVDWLAPYENTGDDFGYKRLYRSVGTVVMGMNTYKQVVTFGETYKGKNVVVLTHTKKKDFDNVRFMRSGLKKKLTDLKKNSSKDIWLVGGSKTVATFERFGLIDKYIISIIPTLLGEGISLFSSGIQSNLTLRKSESYSSGIVQLTYTM